MNLAVIGYGNPLRGDDGFGWRVIDMLRSEGGASDALLESHHQLTPEMAELLSRLDRVIFVDVSLTGEPGEVTHRELVAPPKLNLANIHQFTVETLLAYSSQLFGRAPEAYLVTTVGASFDYEEVLSDAASRAVPAAVRCVRDLLQFPFPASAGSI
ncbi:MAG: hydrogenase maturation protease [bacterium]|nr:hydrogenase maturation protease [bacterium]